MIDSTRRVLAVSAVLTVVFVASALAVGGVGWADVGLLALNTVPLLALRRNPLLAVLVFGAGGGAGAGPGPRRRPAPPPYRLAAAVLRPARAAPGRRGGPAVRGFRG